MTAEPRRSRRRRRLPSPATLARAGLVLLALNLTWRAVRYGLDFPLWGDEAMVAVNFFDRGPRELTLPLDHLQVAPILWLLVEWSVSRVLGLGEAALRLQPFLAGVASAILFHRLARRLLDRRGALAALALFAASYYPVRHAAEIKPYSTDMLCALILLLLGHRLWLAPGDRRGWTWFTLAAAVGAWVSYPSVLVSGGVVAVLGVRALRGGGGLPGSVVAGAALVGSFLTNYLTVGRTQAHAGTFLLTSSHWDFTFPPVSAPWLLPLWFFDVHTGLLFAYPNGGNHGGSTATFLLFVVGAVALWRRGRRGTVWLLLGAFPLMFVAAALKKYPYGGSARIAQHLAPAICLLAGAGLVAAARAVVGARRVHVVLRLWVGALALFALGGIVRDVREPFKHAVDARTRDVMARLGAESGPHDRWVVFASVDDVPWAPRFTRKDENKGWGGSAVRFQYYVMLNAPGRTASAPGRAAFAPPPETVGVPPDGGRVLLLSYHDDHAVFPQEAFDRYLARLAETLGEPGPPRRFPIHDRRPESIGARWVPGTR